MKESPVSPEPTPEFQALSMVLAAWLSMQEARDRDAFGMALLRVIDQVEAEPLNEADAAKAVSWVRALVREIQKAPAAA